MWGGVIEEAYGFLSPEGMGCMAFHPAVAGVWGECGAFVRVMGVRNYSRLALMGDI